MNLLEFQEDQIGMKKLKNNKKWMKIFHLLIGEKKFRK